MKFKIYSLFFLLHISPLTSKIRILLTTALVPQHFEFRKDEYNKSIKKLKLYGYSDFYIVEAVAGGPITFLNEYSTHLFYATTNDPRCTNQGINESRTILEALTYFNFDPEDMIIKLTGRHRFISDYFLRFVEENPQYDAIVKICSGLYPAWMDGMVATMCFAMKCKYLQEMYQTIDYDHMRHYNTPIEWVVADYIEKKKSNPDFSLYVIDMLGIRVNAFASSASPGLVEKIFIL